MAKQATASFGGSCGRLRHLALVGILLCAAGLRVFAAASVTLSGSIDPQFVTLGENATLSITFQGTGQQAAPPAPSVTNLQIRYLGPSSQISIGGMSSTVTHNYTVTPLAAGDYVIPGVQVDVAGERLSTAPLQLKVLKPEAPSQQAIDAGTQPVFLKVVVPKQELYVGEVVAAELQIHVRADIQGLEDFQLASLPAEGLAVGKLVQGRQRQTRTANAAYNVIPLAFTVRALKAGPFALGPANASIVIQLPSRGRRDPFEFFNLGERKRVTLATDPIVIQGLALPSQDVPPSFNGAVGQYTMSVTAGPTNVAVGDPITVKVQINGHGALETVNFPDQTAWRDFKLYPPTSQLETTDALGIQGTRSFEQVVAPEHAEVKALPSLTFAYFDPGAGTYRVLAQPALALTVRSAGVSPLPSVVATNRTRNDAERAVREIVHIKPRPGVFAQVQPPLLARPWFVALQVLPLLAWVGALVWRRRSEHLAANPRLARSRRVNRTLRDGTAELRRAAAQGHSDAFFATLFRLLQEVLGERLDLPATAITEAVIEEQLRPRGVAEPMLNELHELFQACNVARYAPVKSTQELSGLLGRFERVVTELRGLRL